MSGFVEKIEYPELRELNKEFCTLFFHKMFGFLAKLNLHNYKNSTGNCVQYMYGMSGFAEKLNI